MRVILLLVLLICRWGYSHELNYSAYNFKVWHINNTFIKATYVKSTATYVVLELKPGQFKSFPIHWFDETDQTYIAQIKSKIESINNTTTAVSSNKKYNNFKFHFSYIGIFLGLLLFLFIINIKYRFNTLTRLYTVGIVSIIGIGFTSAIQNKMRISNSPLTIDSAFAAFKPHVQTFWNASYFYVESTGIPNSHAMMYGISNHGWQQQVPIPQCYKGTNAWPIPLSPVISNSPIPVDSIHFTRGAIAIAVNGVPIFNVHTNTGVDSYLDGQLDQFGGHCGRADDYHYHIAPLHLYSITSASLPIAYALDGFAIYGSSEPEGGPMLSLDANHGHFGTNGTYHYHGTQNAPYMIAKMVGKVTEDATHQLIPQAAASPVRTENWTPLNGALITSCTPNPNANGYNVSYQLNGIAGFATTYSWSVNGVYSFTYSSPGSTLVKTYNGFIPCSINNNISFFTLDQPIEIFPNPCHLLLNIKTKYDMQFPYCVCIRDLEGKIVYFNSQNVSQISLRDLKKGVYVLELYNTEHHYKKTFIKEY